MRQNVQLDARACLSTYVGFSVIFGLLMVLALVVCLKEPGNWGIFWLCLGLWVAFMIWIATFRLTVTEEELAYRALFSGQRSIILAQISKAETSIHAKDAFGPFYRLTLYSVLSADDRPLIINLKVFALEDLRSLFKILEKYVNVKHK